MAKILYIREVNNALLLLALDEEGECVRYTVSRSLYSEIGAPVKGCELLDGEADKIKRFDEIYRAKKKALSLLSYSDKSESVLKQRLFAAGFSKESAEKASFEMVKLGYINEEGQLTKLILNEANLKLRGPMKIIPYLRAKGYLSEDIKRVMHALVESGEVDFKKNAKKLLEKHRLSESDVEDKKIILYKNGYKI